MQAPVDMYIHHSVRITEQAGVCVGECGYPFMGHGQHRSPAHVLQDTHGIVNPFEKRFQLLVILPVQMFLIGQGGGYIRLFQAFQSRKYKMQDTGMVDVQAPFKVACIGTVQERTGTFAAVVVLFKEYVLFVYVGTVGHVPEGFPVHPVPFVDVFRGKGIALRLPELERDAYATAPGQDHALSFRLADNVKYAVCFFFFHLVSSSEVVCL